MKKMIKNIVFVSLLGLSTMALAGGDVEAGKAKSESCVLCHGEAGKGGAPGFPVLAGQHSDYLYQALVKYQAGQRQNPMMAGVVKGLSEQDMQDLAAYFAAQSGLTVLKR